MTIIDRLREYADTQKHFPALPRSYVLTERELNQLRHELRLSRPAYSPDVVRCFGLDIVVDKLNR